MTAIDVLRGTLIDPLPTGDECAACGNRVGREHAYDCACKGGLEALADLDALVQAAQADVSDYRDWRSLPGNEHKTIDVMENLAVALARVLGESA